jgi:hypothetical protein
MTGVVRRKPIEVVAHLWVADAPKRSNRDQSHSEVSGMKEASQWFHRSCLPPDAKRADGDAARKLVGISRRDVQ